MTSVNVLGNGIDYTKWQGYTNVNNSQAKKTTNVTNTNYENDQFVSQGGETCTDGKDDGKIGLGSALWNTIKGIGKTAVNMVKGCFTGKDGKFSLGKTLLTAATAALCIAFPAVGLVACGIGAVSGAIQIGKGIYNAATADTDAEAKLAWQDIGGGALTTGLSVAGAKASYSAVMKTSTAGASAAGFSKTEIAELQSLGENCSAMGQLGKDASLLSKGAALVKDMTSSTVNQFGKIQTSVTSSLSTAKNVRAEVKELNQMRKANADALAKQAKGEPLTEAELKAISDWENLSASDFSEAALNKVNKQNTLESLKADLKEAQGTKNKAAVEEAKANLQEFKDANPNAVRKTANNIKENLTEGFDKIDEAADAWGMTKLNVTSAKFAQLKTNIYYLLRNKGIDLHSPIKSTINRLKVEEPELYAEYGYENILAVLETLAGTDAANQTL